MAEQFTHLTDNEVTNLVTFLVEDFGLNLSCDAFAEAMGLMLENLPGLEGLDPVQLGEVIEQAYRVYASQQEL